MSKLTSRGFPQSFGSRFDRSLAEPVVAAIRRRVTASASGKETHALEIEISSHIAASHLSIQLLDAQMNRVWSGSAEAGQTTIIGKKANLATFVRLRWKKKGELDGINKLGRLTLPIAIETSVSLAFTELPAMGFDLTKGAQVGTTIAIDEGVFVGAPKSSANLTLWTIAPEDVGAEDYADVATLVPLWLSGFSLITSDMVGRVPIARASITDGQTTVYGWSTPGPVITDIPSVDEEITLQANQARVEGVFNKTTGWQPVIWIDPNVLDASLFQGYGASDGLKVEVFWTQLTTTVDVMLANWMPLVPGDWTGLVAPKTTAIDPAYTGAAGYWRVDERPDQTTANAGGQWQESYFLKSSRKRDTEEPRRVIRIRVSKNGGRTTGNIPTWYLQPNIPSTPTDVIEVSTTAQFQAAFAAAKGGETISLLGGAYTPVNTFRDRDFTNRVTIKAADKNNPPVISGPDALEFIGCGGVLIDGLHFAYDVQGGGSKGIRLAGCRDFEIRNCNILGFKEQFIAANSGDRLNFHHNTMRKSYMDFVRIFGPVAEVSVTDNLTENHGLWSANKEHRDHIQVAVLPTLVKNGRYGSSKLTISRNVSINDTLETVPGDHTSVCQNIFVYNDMLRVKDGAPYPTYGAQHFDVAKHTDLVIEDNFVVGHSQNAIAVAGVDGGSIQRNVIRATTKFTIEQTIEKPTINTYIFSNAGGVAKSRNLTIRDNVFPYPMQATIDGVAANVTGATLISSTVANNQQSATAFPTGWKYGTGRPPAGQYAAGSTEEPDPLVFASLANMSVEQGKSSTYNISSRVSGGKAPYRYAISPTVAGIDISSVGIISVSSSVVPGSQTYSVTVTDSDGASATRTLSISVLAGVVPLALESLGNQKFTRGQGGTYNISAKASGGTAPYSWAISPTTSGITLGSDGIIKVAGTAAVQAAKSYTVTLSDSAGASVTRSLTIEVETQGSGTTGPYWRPLERTPGARTSAPNDAGFGYQYMRCMMACEDEPDYIIGGGDMNGIRISDTCGKTWFVPESRGLRVSGYNSVFIDPRDPNRLLALGSANWWGADSKYAAYAGMWQSTDLGKTWRLAQKLDTASDGSEPQEHFNSTITYDRSSRSLAAGKRVIYCLLVEKQFGKSVTGFQLWSSNTGGDSWFKVGSRLASDAFGGSIFEMTMAGGTLWLAAQNGLYKNTNPTANVWTKVTAGDLPDGNSICVNVAASPDGQTIFAAYHSGALYKSTNSGTGWTRGYNAVGIKRMSVAWDKPAAPSIFLALNSDATKWVSSKDGGATFSAPTEIIWPVGWKDILPNDNRHGQSISDVQNKVGFFPICAPWKAGVCLTNAGSRIRRTEDYGKTFRDATVGFTGINWQAFCPTHIGEMQDDPNYVIIPCQDTAALVSTDGGRSFTPRICNIDRKVYGWDASAIKSTYCAEWLPKTSAYPNGVILIGTGGWDRQGLARSTDLGKNYTAITEVKGQMRYIKKHPTKNVVVAGSRYSKDYGLTWAVGSNYTAIGLSKNGTLYGIDTDNQTIYRSTDWADKVLAGLSPTFTEFWKTTGKLTKRGLKGPMAKVSRAEDNTVWIANPSNNDLYRIRNTSTGSSNAVLTRFQLAGVDDVPTGTYFEIADFQPDPRDPNLVYATPFGMNDGVVFRGVLNGNNVAWTAIGAKGMPPWMDLGLAVREHTGDVFCGGGVGPWAFPPPDGYRAAFGAEPSIWPDLSEPVRPRAAA